MPGRGWQYLQAQLGQVLAGVEDESVRAGQAPPRQLERLLSPSHHVVRKAQKVASRHITWAFKVQSNGFRVQGEGCRVQGVGCRVQGAGCSVQGAGRRARGAGLEVGGGFRIQGAVYTIQRPEFRVSSYQLRI